jgi:hypothetical protein
MGKAVAWSYLVLACGISLPSPGISQELPRDIPPNSHYSGGEQGWTCNGGFKQVAQLCVLDTENTQRGGFEVFSGGQWQCRSGYRTSKGFCVPHDAPAHATLVGPEGRWECDWGYEKVESHCQDINPPAHGYVDASGNDWVCYPGYERVGDHCVSAPNAAPSNSAPPNAARPSSEPASGAEPTRNAQSRPEDQPRPDAEPTSSAQPTPPRDPPAATQPAPAGDTPPR